MLRRYLVQEIVGPLVAWTAFLCLLFFVMAFLKGTDVLLGSSVHLWDLARVTGYLLPQFIAQAVPVAFLLATLLGIGRLSEDGELKAMQSLGIGPFAFFRGPLWLGLALSVFLVALGSTLLPWGMTSVRLTANEIIRRNLMEDIRPGIFHEDVMHFTLYAEAIHTGGNWGHVLLFDNRDPSTASLAVARSGRVHPAQAQGGLAFTLKDGTIHRAAAASDEYTTIAFDQASFIAEIGEQFHLKNRLRSPRDEQTPLDLLSSARHAEQSGEPRLPFDLALHWRLGQMLMPLAFAFLGAPAALLRRGGGRARGFLLTLGAYTAYYVLARMAVQLGERGWLWPALAGQVANLTFLVIGAAVMWRLQKRGVA